MSKVIRNSVSNSKKNQKGLTMISWIVVIVFLLFQGVMALNVVPVYMTDSSVKKIMEDLPGDPKAKGLTAKQLKILLTKRLSINSIYTVNGDHITVKTGRGVNRVVIEYEPRGKLVGTLDFIVSFKHEAKVSAR